MASDPCLNVCPGSDWRHAPVYVKGTLAAPACPNPTPGSPASSAGSSGSSGSSGCASSRAVVDVLCVGGISYVIHGTPVITFTNGAWCMTFADLTWDTDGCCECTGSSGGSTSGSGSGSSGGSSGGSSSGTETSCCPGVSIPNTLTFTITAKTGNCSCLPDSGTATYNPSTTQWDLPAYTCGGGLCEGSDTFHLGCGPVPDPIIEGSPITYTSRWLYGKNTPSNAAFDTQSSSLTCSPFSVTFNRTVGGGSYTITFTA